MGVLVLPMVLLALAMLQGFFIKRFFAKNLTYHRTFSRHRATQGDTVELTEVIENRKPLFLPWLRIETRMDENLVFHTKEDVDIRHARFHKSVFTLMPYAKVTRRHKVLLKKRGHYKFEDVTITCGDLLGICAPSCPLISRDELFVYPKLLDTTLNTPSTRFMGDVSVRRFIINDPFLVNGLRAYTPGDPVRDIHWAASARTNTLQVKTHDFTADPKLMVLINVQKSERQWNDLMDYEQDAIEYAISMAATLTMHALRNGVEAGFAANMPIDDEKQGAFFPPSRGAGYDEALMCAFSALKIKWIKSFLTFLEDMSLLSGMDIVVLSCYSSPLIEERLTALRHAGNTVTLLIVPESEVTHG